MQYWDKLINAVFQKITGLRHTHDLLMILFIFIICAVIFTIMFFLMRNVSSVNFRSRVDMELEGKSDSSSYDMKHLEDLIDGGDFSGAVVYIHRCSVVHMIKKQVIFSANMTNFSIYLKILDDAMRESFKQISRISEKVLFDEYEAGYDDAVLCKKLFTESINR